MSLITCCPTCQTMFQVSGDDLRVSDGWVRCGKCNGVFDASAHLQAMPSEPPESPAPSAPSAPEVLDDASDLDALRTDDLAPSAPTAITAITDTGALVVDPRFEPSPATLRREDQSARPSLTQAPATFAYPSRSPRSHWRLLFWLLALALLGGALLGWARHERQALVQRLPAVLPALELLCKFSACELKAPRLLDAIMIEDAAIEGLAPSDYRIRLVLKNTANVALELPNLKVILTGPQGDVLASHVASPEQFAPGLLRLAAGVSLRVAFSFPVVPVLAAAEPMTADPAPAEVVPAEAAQAPAALPVSAYRVTAFYP